MGSRRADAPVGRDEVVAAVLDTAADLFAERGPAAHTIALQLGWVLFGGFLRASTGLEDLDDRTFARSIGQTVAMILDAEGPT